MHPIAKKIIGGIVFIVVPGSLIVGAIYGTVKLVKHIQNKRATALKEAETQPKEYKKDGG